LVAILHEQKCLKMTEDAMILRELKNISKILTLANASVIETELSKIANSDARKRMWILIDGKRMPKDLAKEVDVTPMTVSNFLTALAAADFVEYTQREPPSRKLNYIPPSWISLVVKEKAEETPKNEEKKVEDQSGEQK
jgi:DNA-binding MarR family transcriptional regulator